MMISKVAALCALVITVPTLVFSEEQCRLYLGPSSTSTDDEPKLGVYAGVDYDENATVGRPEIAIPLIDFSESWNRRDESQNQVMDFIEGFLWTSDFAGCKWEGSHAVTVAIPGVPILAQYHAGTHNIEWSQGSVFLRDRLDITETGKSHPTRGAISNYHNLTMKTVKPIKKGMELFPNFGDVWDGEQNANDIYGDKLTRWDYEDADKILDKILAFMEKYEKEMDEKTKDSVLDFILGKVLGTAAGNHAKVVRSLIPAHPGKLQTVKDMGGTFAYRNPDLVKTQKWLDKHATCIDNLESKPSTIKDAGRGAFATRSMKKNDIIAPIPFMHIADKDLAMMFEVVGRDMSGNSVAYAYDETKPLGQQLLVNYCFTHPESSVMLFPMSPIVTMINHASPEKANARLTWSKNKYWGTAFDLLDMKPKDLGAYHHVSLTAELYALRDLEEGEEIFIDYGRDWERAWKTFKKEYKETEWPIKAEDMNVEYKGKPFKTVEELESDPYPENIMTTCFIESEEAPDGQTKVNADGMEINIWTGPATFANYRGINHYSCTITGRHESGDFLYNYTVLGENAGTSTEVINVPHAAITFVDMPYTSDVVHPDVFRHPIGIPDAIVPQAWRDRRG